MNRYEVIKDKRFIDRCYEFGLDWRNFEICNGTIVVATPAKKVYILLDNKYNIIGITKKDNNYLSEIVECNKLYNDQTLYWSAFRRNETNPFRNFTLKQLVELANRIDVLSKDKILVNGELVIDNYGESINNRTIYLSMLLYIKFLNTLIEEYYHNAYHMEIMDLKYPDIYLYITRIIFKIEEFIEIRIKNYDIPYEMDILDYLGLRNEYIWKRDIELKGIINLLLNIKGYKIKVGINSYEEIVPTTKSNIDIVSKADDLLSLLEVSDEEVKARREEYTKAHDLRPINLEEYLSQKRDSKAKLLQK